MSVYDVLKILDEAEIKSEVRKVILDALKSGEYLYDSFIEKMNKYGVSVAFVMKIRKEFKK